MTDDQELQQEEPKAGGRVAPAFHPSQARAVTVDFVFTAREFANRLAVVERNVAALPAGARADLEEALEVLSDIPKRVTALRKALKED